MGRPYISVDGNFDKASKIEQKEILAIGRDEWCRLVQVIKKDAEEKYDDFDCALLKHAVTAYLKYYGVLDPDMSKNVRDSAKNKGELYHAYHGLIEDYDFFY